jgi:hypothetical protein
MSLFYPMWTKSDRLLEGTIWAEFETGSFTEFTVSLPVCTKKPAVMEVF